jgi:hypothetical protein
VLSVLPQLTWLLLGSAELGASLFEELSCNRLTALQRLQLRNAYVIPSQMLDFLTGLKHLEVQGVHLGAQGDMQSTEAFLAALSRLRQLSYLQLRSRHHTWAPSLQAYSALTASSMLQELHINLPTIYDSQTLGLRQVPHQNPFCAVFACLAVSDPIVASIARSPLVAFHC